MTSFEPVHSPNLVFFVNGRNVATTRTVFDEFYQIQYEINPAPLTNFKLGFTTSVWWRMEKLLDFALHCTEFVVLIKVEYTHETKLYKF